MTTVFSILAHGDHFWDILDGRPFAEVQAGGRRIARSATNLPSHAAMKGLDLF
jgi:hypothetical protein